MEVQVHNLMEPNPISATFHASDLNVNNLRPWIGRDGRAYVTEIKVNRRTGELYKDKRLVANATLRRDEWKALDDAVLRISEERLVGISDLQARGLTYNITNGMGKTVLEYHDMSNALEAEMTMDGITKAPSDTVDYGVNYMPLPIVHADFRLNLRVLAASRNMGDALDTTLVERATRKVSEKLEDFLFTDTSYPFGGGTIYTYVSHPDVNTVSLGTNWDASAATGATVIDDVRAMKQASIDAKHYGPWMLYVPTSYETVLDDDYVSNYPRTIRERIKGIDGIIDVKVADKLPDDTVIMVQMTSDVVRLVNGMPINTIQWETQGKMAQDFKVMAIMVPQIRSDQDGNSGIVKLA